MDTLETWLEFRKGEIVDEAEGKCYHCGRPCSGDVQEEIDGHSEWICDDPDNCPALV